MDNFDREDFYKAFGAFVREARANARMFQMEVSGCLGITQSHYSRIEAGERNVDFATVVSICKCLNLNINDFVEQYFAENE